MGKLESKIVDTFCSSVADGGGRTLAVFGGVVGSSIEVAIPRYSQGPRERALSNLLLPTHSCLARAAPPVSERRPLLQSLPDQGTIHSAMS